VKRKENTVGKLNELKQEKKKIEKKMLKAEL